MSDSEKYDAIVIGSGKGGKILATYLGKQNHKVALIERDPMMIGRSATRCSPIQPWSRASIHFSRLSEGSRRPVCLSGYQNCKPKNLQNSSMEPDSSQDKAKRAAGVQAIATYLKNGMKIGLGSGTTSRWFIHTLGDRAKQGLEVIGVPTSNSTRDLARQLGVPLADLNDVGELDLTIDGADEIDANGRMIKGGAANLLWEKIIACASMKMVALVDESKVVSKLGKFPLPIEVIPFGWRTTEGHLKKLFSDFGRTDAPIKVRGGLQTPLITDSGHYLLDCELGEIGDPDGLALKLNQIPGVVEHGLFIGIAKEVVIGRADGSAEVRAF